MRWRSRRSWASTWPCRSTSACRRPRSRHARRGESATDLLALAFDGYAVGGLCVGEPPEETARVAADTVRMLPENRPRYLMGMGTPQDLLTFTALGYDLFDCVLPTRNGRNGT